MLLAAWAVQQDEVVRGLAVPYAIYFCFCALIVPVLLSWYHDQSRMLAVSLALALTVFGWVRLPVEAHAARLAMLFFLPLIFLLTEVFSQQRVLTATGALRLGLVAGAALAVAWLRGANDGWWTAWLTWGEGRSRWTWLPWTVQLSFAVGALLILLLAVRRRSKTEQAMLWALLATFLGAHGQTPAAIYFYYGTAGLIVMFAVLEHSVESTDRDELTGLPGRRAFNRALEGLGRHYALAMCDVDHFKRFNDTYGHQTGDQVLRMVAARLSRISGDSEVFRFGGEEFVIVFRDLAAAEAEPLADSVRQSIAEAGFVIRGPNRPAERPVQGPLPAADKKLSVTITISIGLAEASSKDSSPEAVLRAADQALYAAKEAGRNRLCIAGSARASGALAP